MTQTDRVFFAARVTAIANVKLSQRELQTLEYLVHSELSMKEIAGEMGISYKTVDTYKTRVFDKFGVRSRHSLVRRVLHANN